MCLICLTFFLLYSNCLHNLKRDLNTSYTAVDHVHYWNVSYVHVHVCCIHPYITWLVFTLAVFFFLFPMAMTASHLRRLRSILLLLLPFHEIGSADIQYSSRSTTLWCYCPKIVPYTFVLTDVLLLCGACQCGCYVNVWANFSDVDSPKTTTWQHDLNNTTKIDSIHF